MHRSPPANSASTSGSLPTVPGVIEAPLTLPPLSSFTSPSKNRSNVLAPTVVSHGTEAGPPIVAAPDPLFPAEVATKTPASAANRNAMSSALERLAPPPTE